MALDGPGSLHDQPYPPTYRALSAVTAIQSTRYYFGAVRLSISRVTLSMLTTSKLTPDLKAIKNAVSTRLIAFEQANIDLSKSTNVRFLVGNYHVCCLLHFKLVFFLKTDDNVDVKFWSTG